MLQKQTIISLKKHVTTKKLSMTTATSFKLFFYSNAKRYINIVSHFFHQTTKKVFFSSQTTALLNNKKYASKEASTTKSLPSCTKLSLGDAAAISKEIVSYVFLLCSSAIWFYN
jgi:hypothetical protein